PRGGGEPRRRGPERFDAGRNLRQRVEDPDQARELLLGAVLGASEDLDEIVRGEQRSQHQQARQVELTGGDRVEQRGKAAHETGGGDAPKRLVFRETKLVNAIAV